MLNGKPIGTYSLKSLQEQILILGQDEILLNEPLPAYLETVCGSSFDREKGKEILRFTDLDKEDIVITNNGLSLSAGQRKKLLLSKLLLCWENASVIILDEPEAGLDKVMFQKYIDFLRRMFAAHNKIIITIAHTIDSELPFDRILHFEGGKMTEVQKI